MNISLLEFNRSIRVEFTDDRITSNAGVFCCDRSITSWDCASRWRRKCTIREDRIGFDTKSSSCCVKACARACAELFWPAEMIIVFNWERSTSTAFRPKSTASGARRFIRRVAAKARKLAVTSDFRIDETAGETARP